MQSIKNGIRRSIDLSGYWRRALEKGDQPQGRRIMRGRNDRTSVCTEILPFPLLKNNSIWSCLIGRLTNAIIFQYSYQVVVITEDKSLLCP